MNAPARRKSFDGLSQEGPRQLKSQVDNEADLLGAILFNNAVLSKVGDLEPKHFEEPLHQRIYEEIKRIIQAGKKATAITLKNAMADVEKVGDITFSEYISRMVTHFAPGFESQLSAVIREAYARREMISTGRTLQEYAFVHETELMSCIVDLEKRFRATAAALEAQDEFNDEAVLDSYLSMITGDAEGGDDGVPMPFPEMEYLANDNMLRPGRIYGILAASGEGKTSLTLHMCHAAVMAGHPVCFFSYDQDKNEILAQMAAQNTGVPFTSQVQNSRNRPRLSQHDIDKAYRYVNNLKRHPFDIIDCTTKDTVARLEVKMDAFLNRRANGKTPLFVFDHIRAIKPEAQGDEGSKALQVGQDIKGAMKHRKAAGWILQQRSTTGLKRPNPRPATTDLYGGDAARQPFDTIFYLFRAIEHMEEQLKTAPDEKEAGHIKARFRSIYGDDVPDIEPFVELGLVKSRFGNRKLRKLLKFDPEFTRFSSIDQRRQGGMF